MEKPADVPRPLAGLKVLELAQNLAGPYCAQILADLGAEVTKVEGPAGDAARAWGPPFIGGNGSIFAVTNRGKAGVVLDISGDAGRAALRALIEDADVLIEAFRPGSFARLGYDWETVRTWNPRLIYCSVLAYGEVGPLSELPGYDPLMQAHGGIMSITGSAERARVGTSVVDMGTGMWLTIAVMAALRERDRTGAGSRVSASLYDTALAWNAYHLAAYHAEGVVPVPMGSQLPMIVPYGAFRTTDGAVMIAAANDGLFRKLCSALRLHMLAGDERLATNPQRVAHRAEVNAALERALQPLTTDEALSRLREAGVPAAPVLDMAEVAADPQTVASGMVVHDVEAGPAIALPIRFNGVRPATGGPPPGFERV